jgi:integrase
VLLARSLGEQAQVVESKSQVKKEKEKMSI